VALALDTGSLIAFERGDRQVAAMVEAARRRRERVVTSSGCIAQAWRDPRQVLLARLLKGVKESALDEGRSRSTGELCAAAGTADVVDAHLALLMRDDDIVLTSDEADLRHLLATRGVRARTRPC
jgi:hypothetical protein